MKLVENSNVGWMWLTMSCFYSNRKEKSLEKLFGKYVDHLEQNIEDKNLYTGILLF